LQEQLQKEIMMQELPDKKEFVGDLNLEWF